MESNAIGGRAADEGGSTDPFKSSPSLPFFLAFAVPSSSTPSPSSLLVVLPASSFAATDIAVAFAFFACFCDISADCFFWNNTASSSEPNSCSSPL